MKYYKNQSYFFLFPIAVPGLILKLLAVVFPVNGRFLFSFSIPKPSKSSFLINSYSFTFQNNPYMHVIFEILIYYALHIQQRTIFKSHPLRSSIYLPKKMLVPIQRDISYPPYLLVPLTTINLKILILDMYLIYNS